MLPVVYGYPGPEMFAASERGEVALGGCVIGPDMPTFACAVCGHTEGEVR